MNLIKPTANFLQGITLKAFADCHIEGQNNVPSFGPLIIVANHQSNFDPALLSATIPRHTLFLAKKDIFSNPISSWLLRLYGAYPLDRSGASIGAYRWALTQLYKGQPIVIFPEGTRNPKGMGKAKLGVSQIALKSQSTLLPVGITGTERFNSWTRVFNPTGEIRVRIGPAFYMPSIDGNPNKKVLESLTDMIMNRIAILLPREYQGAYGIETFDSQQHSEVPNKTLGK